MATRPITISIQGDSSGLSKALRTAEKGVTGFAKNVGKLGIKAGAAFAGVAAAVGVQGVRAAADFEAQLQEVLTLLPEAGENVFGQLSDQVKDFSKEFGVLPNEVIPSLYQAISAGVPQENVFEFLEVAQKAAKGGVTDLETAVDGISSVVNAYGADVISATEASDLMFTAVRLGKTDFTQLSNSLFQVAPIAAGLGVDFGNVTAALANLTAQGTPTKVAATQLKATFSELAKEGTKADVNFRELAGVGFAEFIAQGGNVQEAFQLMADGAEANNISILDMFGSIEAGQGVLALTADGGKAFTASLSEMEGSAGATETAFETMDQGLTANFEKIKANLAVLSIEIGQKLAPIVARATSFIVNNFDNFVSIAALVRDRVIEIARDVWPILVRGFDEAVKIVENHLIPAFHKTVEIGKEVIKFVRRNADVILILTGAVGGAVVGFKAYQVALKGIAKAKKIAAAASKLFNAALNMNPIMIVVTALAALTAALVVAYTRSERFREIVDEIGRVIREVFVTAFEYAKPIVESILESFKVAFEVLWDVVSGIIDVWVAIFKGDFSEAFSKLGELVGTVFEGIGKLFTAFPGKLLTEVLPALVSALGRLISEGFGYFKDQAMGLIDDVVSFFVGIPETLLGLYIDYLNAGKNLASGLISGMVSGIKGAAGFTLGLAKDIINAITGFINDNLIDPFNDLLEFKIPIPFAPDINVNPPDIPRIPELAQGGIVKGSTLALLGDNPSGTEAIVPLERASEMGFGGTTTFNINVNAGMGTDGRRVGAEIISALKQWQRSNGTIPITTS